MTSKYEKELIAVLKSGNFTVSYYDSGQCIVYKGKFKEASDCPNPYEYDSKLKDGIDYWKMDILFDGYTPEVVHYLVKALGGKSNSI